MVLEKMDWGLNDLNGLNNFGRRGPGAKWDDWEFGSARNAPPLTLANLLAALSRALDLTEGMEPGHAVRSCLIGLRLADILGMALDEQAELHLALLIKDAGCSSNSARMHAIYGADDIALKRDGKLCDWCNAGEAFRYAASHVAPNGSWIERTQKMVGIARIPGRLIDEITETRCTRGAAIAARMGLSSGVIDTILHLDEHFDGRGAPFGVKGDAIPLFARIACLAQSLDAFVTAFGVRRAYEVLRSRTGTWYDPELVHAAGTFQTDLKFWQTLYEDAENALGSHTTQIHLNSASLTEDALDGVCDAFAGIVDAKSPYTADHSLRVSQYAYKMARQRDLSDERCINIRRAGLLHDLGKLGVSNAILEKPGKLTSEEFALMKGHPASTARILAAAPALRRLAEIAVSHHEKLDGSGYHLGLTGDALDTEMRILVVADIYDALTADRPYRAAMPIETALNILHEDENRKLDRESIIALREIVT